jgi:activator of HSP90 ATPase
MSQFTRSESDRERRRSIMKAAAAGLGLTLAPGAARAAEESGVSRSAEAIHQEIRFPSPPRRVYAALTDAEQFQKIEELSAAMNSLDVHSHPATISRMPGGAFALFGGYIVGRQLELVGDQRIVQAWRVSKWEPGIFSIARFALTPAGGGTMLIFDHTGFPPGTAEHLAHGWHANYWDPMRKFLA